MSRGPALPGVRLVLASRSPQRRAILELLGIAFEVDPADVEETVAGDPRTLVVENSLRKARAVRERRAADLPVLGADTAVTLGKRVLGKPRDREEARAFLEGLAGRTHTVWSGIALVEPQGEVRTGAAATDVRFRALEPAEVEAYLASREWRGRAGGYAIQGAGAGLVERIEGDYWNVVGLPVAELARLEPRLGGRVEAMPPRRDGP